MHKRKSVSQLIKTIVHAGECLDCEVELDVIACDPDNILRVITKNTEQAHRALTLLLTKGIDPNEIYKCCSRRTAIEQAVKFRNFEAIRIISSFGGNFEFLRRYSSFVFLLTELFRGGIRCSNG